MYCWAREKSCIIRLDIIHHIISCEFSKYVIKETVENKKDTFKKYYTNSNEKKKIIIQLDECKCDENFDRFIHDKEFKQLFTDIEF